MGTPVARLEARKDQPHNAAMYCPAHFSEADPGTLRELIEQHPLGALVVQTPQGLSCDHIPMLHDADGSTHGRLIGHVARSNPVWQHAPGQELLVVFQGVNGYISPNWYATKADSGKVVPTWNYAVVHVHGVLKPLHEHDPIHGILTRLTEHHEATQEHPWRVSDAPEDYTRSLIKAIVGFEIAITRMQGKWKVSQNQPEKNRESVVLGLNQSRQRDAQPMAQLVQQLDPARRR
jgi:transcriptional regulator